MCTSSYKFAILRHHYVALKDRKIASVFEMAACILNGAWSSRQVGIILTKFHPLDLKGRIITDINSWNSYEPLETWEIVQNMIHDVNNATAYVTSATFLFKLLWTDWSVACRTSPVLFLRVEMHTNTYAHSVYFLVPTTDTVSQLRINCLVIQKLAGI